MPDPTDRTPATLRAPVTRSAGAELADQIVTAIALGQFAPGRRLPAERDLAESLGVSRATVRDALARVVALDLLEVRRGRAGGAYVRSPWTAGSAPAVRAFLEPRWRALEHVMDARELVEGLVARTAAERRSPDDARAVQDALRAYERADDLTAAQAADVALHRAVARATHNERLLVLREQLLSEIGLGFAHEPFTRDIYDRALPQHKALAEAVIEGRPDDAGDLARAHFAITADELRATLRRATGADGTRPG